MDEKQFEALMRRMEILTKLLAFNVINGKSVNEQVDMLTNIGLEAAEIADILGKTENQIYVTQNLLRKAKKKEAVQEGSQNNPTEVGTNVG